MAENTQLKLDRSHLNPAFNSWKLVDDLVKGTWTLDLAGPATYQSTYGTSYLHTRTAVLHNNLHKLPSGDLLFFQDSKLCKLEREQSAWAVKEIGPKIAAHTSLLPAESQLATSVVEIVQSLPTQPGGQQLLLSAGNGDLTLSLNGVASEMVFPLQQDGSQQAFIVAVAANIAGEIHAVLWSIHDKTSTRPAHVQIHHAILAVDTAATGEPQLQATSVQLLTHAAVGPHLALIDADAKVLVLAIDPGNGMEDTQAAALSQAQDEGFEDDSDAVSPRTMAAAVQRLQHFTQDASAEEAAGPSMCSDLYNEADRDDELTASGAEADCEVLAYTLGGSDGSNPALVSTLSCRPYKVLACEPSSGLLGLSVDVDCAMVQLGCSSQGDEVVIQAQHVATLPALAYVAEGKVQRKFVLLGRPGDPVAAAIVESHKYAYIYRATGSNQANGQHQLADMALPDGSGALGAQLVKSSDGTTELLLLTSKQILGFELA